MEHDARRVDHGSRGRRRRAPRERRSAIERAGVPALPRRARARPARTRPGARAAARPARRAHRPSARPTRGGRGRISLQRKPARRLRQHPPRVRVDGASRFHHFDKKIFRASSSGSLGFYLAPGRLVEEATKGPDAQSPTSIWRSPRVADRAKGRAESGYRPGRSRQSGQSGQSGPTGPCFNFCACVADSGIGTRFPGPRGNAPKASATPRQHPGRPVAAG